MEAYNGGVLFGNSMGATEREIELLGLNAETAGDMEKAQIFSRGDTCQPRSSSARTCADMGNWSSC